MRRVSRAAAVLWSVVWMGGCAALSGLDAIQEVDGAGPSTADGTVDAPIDHAREASAHDGSRAEAGGETAAPKDAAPDQGEITEEGPSDDGSAAKDASPDDEAGPQDASMNDGSIAKDASPDDGAGSKETGTTADTGTDAPSDSACGPLDTTTSCGACGTACASPSASMPTVTSATCVGPDSGVGASCSYACSSGYLDCNAATDAPNTDGCECHSPGVTASGCCSGGCPVRHSYDANKGVAAFFYDCEPRGTYDLAGATDACAAYSGHDPSQCDSAGTYSCTFQDGGAGGNMVCSDGAPACTCWGYDGAIAGLVHVGTAPADASPSNCGCPMLGDPTWN